MSFDVFMDGSYMDLDLHLSACTHIMWNNHVVLRHKQGKCKWKWKWNCLPIWSFIPLEPYVFYFYDLRVDEYQIFNKKL